MKFKLNVLVAALAVLATAGAHAAITNNNAPGTGNSSVLFVAWDTAKTTSLTVDLGVNMADFLTASSFVNSTGALTGAGTTASWSLNTNARSVNGASVAGDYAWSSTFASFVAASGGSYSWGVIAADDVTGAISGTNTVQGRNAFASFNNIDQAKINNLTVATPVSNSTANFKNFVAGTVGGTHATNAEGASTATAGGGYLGSLLKGDFAAYSGWNYLSAIGASSSVFLVNQQANPVVFQIGETYGVDTLLTSGAASFTFDGNTLSYSIPAVPEPGTYAMLIAGLAAIGFMVRRRNNG